MVVVSPTRVAKLWLRLGKLLSKLGRNRPIPYAIGPSSVDVALMSVEIGPRLATIGPTLAGSGPNWSEIGQFRPYIVRTTSGQILANLSLSLDQILADIG